MTHENPDLTSVLQNAAQIKIFERNYYTNIF